MIVNAIAVISTLLILVPFFIYLCMKAGTTGYYRGKFYSNKSKELNVWQPEERRNKREKNEA